MNCPICAAIPAETFRARHATIVKCSDCGHLYAENPETDRGVIALPDPDAMLKQYAARNERLIDYWRRSGFLNDSTLLLDFGAGSGHVLRSIKRVMPRVGIECIEADPESSRFLQSQGFTVYDSLEEAPARRYDAILLIELLEHVDAPTSLLGALAGKLRPGGKIFVTTPCGETRSGYRDLPTYDVREHVQFWTERSFALCCAKAGLVFEATHPGIMYPRRNPLDRITRDLMQSVRDRVLGIRHLVGVLRQVGH